LKKIPKNLLEVRPNVIISIPRLWEKIYDTTKSIVSRQNKTTQSIFNWAMKLGEKYCNAMATATRMGQIDLLQFALANQLVFNKIKKTGRFGSRRTRRIGAEASSPKMLRVYPLPRYSA